MDQTDVFSLVADPDRRRLLRTLLENDGQISIEELATRIASGRQEATSGVTDRKQAKISLVHNHLPRLQEHGVINYDRQSGDVELDAAADLKPYIRAAVV